MASDSDTCPFKARCRHLSHISSCSCSCSSSLSLPLVLPPSSAFNSSSSSSHTRPTHRHSFRSTMMRTSELIPSKTSSQRRSWRRTVAHALALAQSAVELDSTNANPMGALDGYTKSVRQLRRILVRLERHGAHSEASRLATIVCRRSSSPFCSTRYVPN